MWIRVDVATPDGRKARRLARSIEALGARDVPAHDPRVILGTLVMLWIKARIQKPDGVLDGYDATDVADMAGCSSAEAEALIETGWIDQIDGGLELHGWMEHNGDHLREAKRKRDSRAAKTDVDQPSTDKDQPSSGRSKDVRKTSADVHRKSIRRDETGRDGTRRDSKSTAGPDGPLESDESKNGTPARTTPPEIRAVDARDARAAVFQAHGVPMEQWDLIEAYCGTSSDDLSLAANAMRESIAQIEPEARKLLLEPVGEVKRQRVMDLVGSVIGKPASGVTPAEVHQETKPTAKRIHIGAIADMSKSLGKAGQATTIRLASWLFNRGITHDGLLKRFVQHYVTHAAGIKEPFAYYNPKADGFEFIRNRLAADEATEEHETLLAAERRWLQGSEAD